MTRITQRLCMLSALSLMAIGAVQAGPEEDGGYWFNLHMQGAMGPEKWHWSMDTNPRYRNEGKHLDYLYLRPAMFYALNAKTNLWLGFDTITGHPASKTAYRENRVWEQFQYQFDPVGKVTFSNRTRLEERHRAHYHDLSYRLRQMIKATMPLSLHPKLALVMSDELFINLNQTEWGANRGFDQNRLFTGFNWKFNQTTSLEAGYLNQYTHKTTRDHENHVLTATLGFKF